MIFVYRLNALVKIFSVTYFPVEFLLSNYFKLLKTLKLIIHPTHDKPQYGQLSDLIDQFSLEYFMCMQFKRLFRFRVLTLVENAIS